MSTVIDGIVRTLGSVIAFLVLAPVCLPAAALAGTITGRVTDEISGAPVANIRVGVGPVG